MDNLQASINLLEKFHQICILRILNIEWRLYTPDTVVLERTCSSIIEKKLIFNQMRWACHVVRVGDGRLPKQLFYGNQLEGKGRSIKIGNGLRMS